MFRVLLADDQGVMRAGLRALLQAEPDIEIVGEAADCETMLGLVESASPDLIVTELSLPGMPGVNLIRCLQETYPNVRVLILTNHLQDEMLWQSLYAGAHGYYAKQQDGADLAQAIRTVAQGEIYVHPSLVHDLGPRAGESASREAAGPDPTLSSREVDVLRLLVEGYTNRQIAEKLHIGVRTVETHRANLMEKLGLHSRAELVQYAAGRGLFLAGNGTNRAAGS